MSTSQDPTGQPLRSGAPLPQGPLSQRPLTQRPVPRILFWVLIVALYLLGALSLLVRGWLDIGPTATGTAIATAAIDTVMATSAPPTQAVITVAPDTVPPSSATPHPTLTPRRTLYPTLTPRP